MTSQAQIALPLDGVRTRDRGAPLKAPAATRPNRAHSPAPAVRRIHSGMRAKAQAVRERFEHLHLLINNAGTAFPERRLSPEGIECALAVNHLCGLLLTNLLLNLQVSERVVTFGRLAIWNLGRTRV